MNRRDAIRGLTAGAIVAPLSGCLNFAGLRPGSNDDQDDQADGDENAADNESDDSDENTGANESGDGLEDESEEDDEEPDTGEPEDEDGDEDELPDLNEVEERDAGKDVLEFGDLQILDYDKQTEELEHDSEHVSYTGEVENVGDEAYESVTVEVRVYDENGDELSSQVDLTPEIEGGETWRFEISPHSQPDEIDDHDIAVTGDQ